VEVNEESAGSKGNCASKEGMRTERFGILKCKPEGAEDEARFENRAGDATRGSLIKGPLTKVNREAV